MVFPDTRHKVRKVENPSCRIEPVTPLLPREVGNPAGMVFHLDIFQLLTYPEQTHMRGFQLDVQLR